MLVRVLNDNMKTFIQSQGYLKIVGLFSVISFIPFIFLSYYLIYIKNMGALGIGISLLQYEGLCLLFMIGIFIIKIPKKFKNTELNILGCKKLEGDDSSPIV